MDWEPLVRAAHAVRDHAYAPYSHFRVGAAVGHGDGSISVGCNVENRSYGLTTCAERNAVAQAVAAHKLDLAAIAIVADCSPPAPPCGMCLETLTEFAADLPVLLVNLQDERREMTLRQLHPMPFALPRNS